MPQLCFGSTYITTMRFLLSFMGQFSCGTFAALEMPHTSGLNCGRIFVVANLINFQLKAVTVVSYCLLFTTLTRAIPKLQEKKLYLTRERFV